MAQCHIPPPHPGGFFVDKGENMARRPEHVYIGITTQSDTKLGPKDLESAIFDAGIWCFPESRRFPHDGISFSGIRIDSATGLVYGITAAEGEDTPLIGQLDENGRLVLTAPMPIEFFAEGMPTWPLPHYALLVKGSPTPQNMIAMEIIRRGRQSESNTTPPTSGRILPFRCHSGEGVDPSTL
jgi:hypothetical protein